jgi:phosphoribosylformylglycinamidine cyclo-ligase
VTEPPLGTRAYGASGVDLDAAARSVELIRKVAAGASRPEVVDGVGGFAGLYDLGDGRFLAAGTDGVGTKLEVARLAGRLDTVGIDLVGMCANDVVCTGAEPLFFLDYLAVGRMVPEEAAEIVSGVAEGCRRAGCALLGGETAEHPGVLEAGRFDLAGFCVGLVRREDLLGRHKVSAGDVLIGLPSSGLHSNGFSLVRRALLDGGRSLDEVLPDGRLLADELLEPTRIYVGEVLGLARQGALHAAAHITGGGFGENVPRMLPDGLGAIVDRGAWVVPSIFGVVAEAAEVQADELFDVLNMGIGMVLAVPADRADEALDLLSGRGSPGVVVGGVEPGSGLSYV